MKRFKCNNCHETVFFENTKCENCGYALGFDPEKLKMETLQVRDTNVYSIIGEDSVVRYCMNAQHGVCNWLIPIERADTMCTACALNRTIPDISFTENLVRWRKIEEAKHRLIYTLLRAGLPFAPKPEDHASGLAFDFLSPTASVSPVVIGHMEGIITLNTEEADDTERVRNRELLGEGYRTLLGHFRHEIGHYYWDRLVQPWNENLYDFRRLFGDEQLDYNVALQAHYNNPNIHWSYSYVSAYASSHPWEDWAESWAHYLHLMDTLETAFFYGLELNPNGVKTTPPLNVEINQDPFDETDFEQVINSWFPLTIALNSLNRSMGLKDMYPFVIPPPVVDKLKFIHKIVRSQTS